MTFRITGMAIHVVIQGSLYHGQVGPIYYTFVIGGERYPNRVYWCGIHVPDDYDVGQLESDNQYPWKLGHLLLMTGYREVVIRYWPEFVVHVDE